MSSKSKKRSSAHLVMPFLVINMGGEMLYILQQRLSAQSVAEEKSARVLAEVTKTMFSANFVTELFKPQRMYSVSQTREIFDRLAHSSIMRLKSDSMSKLFDLMFMGCKYQMMGSVEPSDILQITLNHLDSILEMVDVPALHEALSDSQDVVNLVRSVRSKTLSTYLEFHSHDFELCQSMLSRFFQDRKVKVSIFLSDKLQHDDGSILCKASGPLPRGGERPGTIRCFNPFSERKEVTSTTTYKAVNAELVGPPRRWSEDVSKRQRSCQLGSNLYAERYERDGKKKDREIKVTRSPEQPESNAPSDSFSQQERRGLTSEIKTDENTTKKGTAELNLLADLIGSGGSSKGSSESAFFYTSLFGGDDDQDGGDTIDVSAPTSKPKSSVQTFTSERDSTLQRIGDDFAGLGGGADESEDDLLALMDGAGE